MSIATLPGLSCLINRKSLLAALNAVSGVVPTRSSKPILQSVLLRIDAEGHANLHATDLEVAIRANVSGVKSDAPGAVILSPAKLASILGSSRDDELSIETDDAQVVIKGLRSKFVLSTEDPDLFPEAPTATNAVEFPPISESDLRTLIRRTSFACDVESTRYALGGCKVELSPGSLVFVGTDGRRLSLQSCDVDEQDVTVGSVVVPLKALRLIDRNLGDDSPVRIFLSSNGGVPASITVLSDRWSIYTRLVEGRFPAYGGVFPKQSGKRIELSIPEFRSAVEQASIVTSDESRGVDFTFGNGVLTLESKAADVGASKVETPIGYEGDPIEITFDPRYVLDCLKSVGDALNVITVELIDAKHAAVFRTDDGLKHVVMPLTRDRG